MDIKTLNIFTNYVFKTILRPAAAMVCGAVSGLYYGHQKTVGEPGSCHLSPAAAGRSAAARYLDIYTPPCRAPIGQPPPRLDQSGGGGGGAWRLT